MNLRFLRTFVAIADNGGVARAAARLNLTQSAASRQIQALEEELGLRLFARIGRGTRLTPEGEDLLERSRRVLSLMSQVKHNVRDNLSPRVLARSWATRWIVQRRGRDLKTSVNKL